MSSRISSIRDLEKRVGEEIAVSPWLEVTQERIDTFDQDVTLWVEHPIYTQEMDCLQKVPSVLKATQENAIWPWLFKPRWNWTPPEDELIVDPNKRVLARRFSRSFPTKIEPRPATAPV